MLPRYSRRRNARTNPAPENALNADNNISGSGLAVFGSVVAGATVPLVPVGDSGATRAGGGVVVVGEVAAGGGVAGSGGGCGAAVVGRGGC